MKIIITILFILYCRSTDYGFVDLSTTNEVFYLIDLDVCYTLNPVEDQDLTFYFKVTPNGNSLSENFYRNKDCSSPTNAYTFDESLKKFESFPEVIGGIRECQKDPEQVPTYFKHDGVCIYATENTWMMANKMANGLKMSISYDNCKTMEFQKEFKCDECSVWDLTGKEYEAYCEDGSYLTFVLLIIFVILLI